MEGEPHSVTTNIHSWHRAVLPLGCCDSFNRQSMVNFSCENALLPNSDEFMSIQVARNDSLKLSLSRSRFLSAMQEILAEIAGEIHGGGYSNIGFSKGGINGLMFGNMLQDRGVEVESKKKHLLSLMEMVDEQYRQCLEQVHSVISTFHDITKLDPNRHGRFALLSISLMHKKLMEKIKSHIVDFTEVGQDNPFHKKLRKIDYQQQLWRPQRGLPDRSVSILKAWMFQNFLHPYPKDAEKHMLALKSGLTKNQVSNWFINARVRLWKPMIEEMCADMSRGSDRCQISPVLYI